MIESKILQMLEQISMKTAKRKKLTTTQMKMKVKVISKGLMAKQTKTKEYVQEEEQK